MQSLLNIKGVCDIAAGIYNVARNKISDRITIDELVILTDYHEDKYFFDFGGVSISDLAFAALKWIDTPYSLEKYETLFDKLPIKRKQRIIEIQDEIYI